MKTMMRFLIIPVVLMQLSFAPKANAEINPWHALGFFGLGAVTGYVVAQLTDNDNRQMQSGYNGAFNANLQVGDRAPWQGQHHSGYFQFESQGRSNDGQYNNCRLVRPHVYNSQGQQAQNYQQPRCACQNGQGGWTEIPVSNYTPYTNQQPAYYQPGNPTYQPTYQYGGLQNNNGITYSGRPLRGSQQYTPQYPQPQPQPYPSYYPSQHNNNGCDNGNLFNLCFTASVGM